MVNAIKKIKNAVPGATVNDVLLAICAGGLRKYMVKHGRLPLKNLVGLAPISVRKEDEKGDMGNRISAMLIDLATNEVDPIRRLEAMVLNTKASKVSSKALPADQIMEFVPSEVAALAGRAYMQLGLSQLHNPFFNLIVTNVPGPPIPLYMNGYKLQRIYGLGAAMDGLGLMMIIFSYAGVISLSATADANVMENMDLYMSLLRDSYEDLYDAVEELELEEA
ncbi:MAG: WS/DGAT domain-containing protein [Saprospiraceae bacterium]